MGASTVHGPDALRADMVRALRDQDAITSEPVAAAFASVPRHRFAPDDARTMCRRPASAYLHATPLPGKTAIRALEPVVNLARLQIRAGYADEGRRHLLTLYDAVSTGVPARFEDISVPADLTVSAEDRKEVRAWLWRVLLADGTRTLTAAGRWAEALAHIEEHHGIGQKMFDGRQVAVLAALTSGDTLAAEDLLACTEQRGHGRGPSRVA